jgi:large repetitive protein
MHFVRVRILFLTIFVALVGLPLLLSPQVSRGASLPEVFNISPRTGPVTGGFQITISGSGFAGATSVSFGADSVTPTVINASLIVVVAPAHAAGVVHLRVTTPAGTSLDDPDDDFTYVGAQGTGPEVLSISPTAGPTGGGTVITITGQNFTGTQWVDFDGQHVVPSSISATQLVVTSPAHAAGIVHLRVQTPAGLSPATAADNFRYTDLPVVNAVAPNSGPTAGGTNVVIQGANLTGAYQVWFGDTMVAPWQVTNTAVSVVAPAHAAGTVRVRVRTAVGLSAETAAAEYTYVGGPPVITAISPTSGPTTGGTVITITGVRFSGATAVRFGVGGPAVTPSSVTDSQVRVTAPAHAAGAVTLFVETPGGTNAVPPFFNFTYVAGVPVIYQVSPRSGPVEGGTPVTISGAGFSGTLSVRFGDTPATIVQITETQLQVVSPPHAAGLVHIRVTNGFGTNTESVLDDFTYGGGGPRITAISPRGGPTSGGTVLTITGTGFAGTFGVVFGDQVVTPTSVSSTQVVAVSPAHAAGVVHVRVIAPGGISPETSADDYTYGGPPVVQGISPRFGSVDGGTVVTITGSGLWGATSVSFGDVAVSPFSVSETQVQVVSPAVSTAGVVHLRVTVGAGISAPTEADNFTYVARPRVTSVSPKTGSTAGGTIVVITGVGFTGVTIVNFGGIGVAPTSVTDTEVRVVSPARAAGLVHLRLTSAGGISPDSATDDFTYVTPGPDFCPALPLWVNDLAYGSIGGGFYYDPVSSQVWTGQRGWHYFAPQPPRPAPQPLWVNAITYGSIGEGFWWDPVSGLVWTGERGWHLYEPRECVARP